MLTAGDVFCFYIRDLNKYGACQILEISSKGICNIVLDNLKDTPLNQDDLKDIKPLFRGKKREHDYFQDYVSFSTIPHSYIYVGNTTTIITQFREIYSNHWPTGLEYILLKEWGEIPEEESEEYNKYQYDRTPVVVGTKKFLKNISKIDDEMLAAISDYSQMDILPRLSSIHINKYYEGLFSYLKNRHYITDFNMWNYNQDCLDLSETLFTQVSLNISGIHTLYLNERTRKLFLSGKAESDLKIYAKNNGAGIYLLYSIKNNILSNFGLREIEDVTLMDIHSFDISIVADQFPALRKLRLYGNPGSVLNLGNLSKIQSLEQIRIYNLFGFASEDIAPLLELENLNLFWMDGVPEEAGKYARKAFKGKVYSLLITKLRKPEWIIENANNPFRGWDGDEGIPAGAFKKASAILKTARTELLSAAEKKDALLAVTKYVDAFNKLDKKHENFIETTQAEDIFNALEGLFDEIVVDKEMMDKEDLLLAFDENRTW